MLLARMSASRRDGGFAIVYVLGTGMIASLIVTLLVGMTVKSTQTSRRDQDYQAAIAAAQAGVDDYLSRLNANSTYWQGFDCSNVAMKKAFPSTGPCGYTSATPVGWQTIAGSTTPAGAACSNATTSPDCPRFHYDVSTTSTYTDGRITIQSTGRSRDVTRTAQVSLVRTGFSDFLYYSDYETMDPANAALFGFNNTTATTECSRHYYDTPGRTSTCYDISFTSGDTIDGPLHSNDALLMANSPLFRGKVSTGWPQCAPSSTGVVPPPTSCYRVNGSASPTFAAGIRYAGVLTLPATNTALKNQVTVGQSNGTAGCLFTGPTRLRFSGSTVTVWSPYTTSVNPGCGTAAPNGGTFTLPANNVIYVQNVPSSQSTPPAGNCATGAIGGLPVQADDNIRYGEYDCRAGTVFVEGSLSGRLTVAAENNVVITGNLTYAGGSTGTDALGLIANNSVEMYHPVNCAHRGPNTACDTGSNLSGAATNPVVNAAILSLAHSFGVQLYNVGAPLGSLTVYGSISQRFRGPVSTFSGTTLVSGYSKNYSYDSRLTFAPPPYFLDPVVSSYRAGAFAEIPPAY